MRSSNHGRRSPRASALASAALASTALASIALAGCATAPVPADRLARAREAVDRAEEVHAQAAPRAAAHLRLATAQIDQAKQQMKNGDNAGAKWTLARAESDAEVALQLAHAHVAKADAERTIEAIRQAMSATQTGGGGS